MLDEFSTPQFNKTISNANGTHDDTKNTGPLSLQHCTWIRLVSERLETQAIESTPIDVLFEQLFSNKVKLIQEKQKKNQMKLDL